MTFQTKLGAMITAACSSAVLAGPVVNLEPGEFTADMSGITSVQLSELRGSIVFDNYQSFSVEGSEGLGDTQTMYEATLLTRVVRSNETGNLTFNFQIQDPNASMSGQVSHIEISGFQGLETRVEYRGESGFGDVGPSIAARSIDGDTLTYDFNETLATGQTSKFFFAMLDVADFNFDGISPTATLWLQSGDAVTLDLGPNVPAPGAMALLGFGGLCMSRRRR